MPVRVGSFLGGSGSLGTLFVRLTADPQDLIKGMERAVAALQTGTGSMAASAAAASAAFASMGAAVAAAGAIIGGVSLKEFAKFDKAMTDSASIMGKMGRDMRKELEGTARDIASNGIIPADKLAASYYTLESAGLNAQQSIKALPIVSKFAAAGFLDMSKSVDLLVGSQNALGLTSKDPIKNMENMERLGNMLTKANQLAKGSVEDFADALANNGASAMREFNIKTEEGIAVLTALAQHQITGRLAGQQFYIMMRELQDAAIKNSQEFDRLNIRVFDTDYNLRSLVDITADLDKAFGGMTSGMKEAELKTLGFEDRSRKSILALLDSSSVVRENTKAFADMGNMMDEVSNNRLTGFSAQATVLWHRIQDLFITIGEALAGPLTQLNEILGPLIQRHSAFSDVIGTIANVVGKVLVFAVQTVIVSFQMWLNIMKPLGQAFLTVSEIALRVFAPIIPAISHIVEEMVNGVIAGVNLAIKTINTLVDHLPDWVKNRTGIGKVSEISFALDLGIDKRRVEEWENSINHARTVLGGMNTDIIHVGKSSAEAGKKTIESFHAAEEQINKTGQRIQAVSLQVNQMLDKMGAPTGVDALGRTLDQQIRDRQKFGKEAVPNIGMSQAELALAGQTTNPFADQGVTQSLQMRKEMEQANLRLSELKKISQKEEDLNSATLARKKMAMEIYNRQVQQLHYANAQFVLNTTSKMFTDMATIAEAFGGKQSGLYKAMFAASKAFAIAEATVKILQGVASAASLPWPANLAAMASVIAATASIVTNIQSVKLEFASAEKKARGGNVRAGMPYIVGEEGEELFVPSRSGNIIPHDKLMGNSGPRVVVNNYTDIQPQVTEREQGGEKFVEIVLRRVKNEIGSEIRDGRGVVSKSLESSFGLRRGQGQ